MNERSPEPRTGDTAQADQTRREALARIGRLAGYTAPAMLALLGATKARAQASGSADGRPNPGG